MICKARKICDNNSIGEGGLCEDTVGREYFPFDVSWCGSRGIDGGDIKSNGAEVPDPIKIPPASIRVHIFSAEPRGIRF